MADTATITDPLKESVSRAVEGFFVSSLIPFVKQALIDHIVQEVRKDQQVRAAEGHARQQGGFDLQRPWQSGW